MVMQFELGQASGPALLGWEQCFPAARALEMFVGRMS